MRKTMRVHVSPIYGARFGVSVRYTYRGKRLHSDTPIFWSEAQRDAALLHARRDGFTHVRFTVVPDWGMKPEFRRAVVDLATVRFPDSELICTLPRVAWTGGHSPRKSRELSKRARSLVRAAFREAMQDSIAYWGDGAALCYPGDKRSTLANARIQWRRAIADAYATIEAAHRARLYR